MKRSCVYILLVCACLFIVSTVKASSATAYQDYLFQFDRYRTTFSTYQVALGEFKKYSSLASEQDALDKAKLLLVQRNLVARTYFLFLTSALSENPSMPATDLTLYQSIITNEIAFLDKESTLAPSLSSLTDVEKTSQEFIKHYPILQSGFRQVIIATQLGYLRYFAKKFDGLAAEAQMIITANKSMLSDTKRSTLDRWILALSNKRSLYQQKVDSVRTGAFQLTGDIEDQDRKFTVLLQNLSEAKQFLQEGSSFFTEIETALMYDD